LFTAGIGEEVFSLVEVKEGTEAAAYAA